MAILPAYTKLLYSNGDLPHSGDSALASPPLGYRWVIRDVVLINMAGGADSNLKPVYLHGDDQATILSTPFGRTTAGSSYRFDGHQVIDHPNFLNVWCQEDGWSLRVTGYELSLTG